MPIRLYDTMRRAKVDFAPANPGRVTMYVCGPTVYGRAHIGNARPAVVFDVLQRLLRHTYGAKNVVYARNITDIDDKIMAAAVAEDVDPKVITDRFEAHYLADMGALGVQPPDLAPHATDNIPAMIAMIATLVAKGAAYAAEGHVLFDVAAPGDYGRLSRRPLDEMIAGARVEVAPYKRNPADFVLWKPSTPDQPGWESPWGRGRPGWHIECSAMIAEHLGETIDIHGGGLDLIFPHHENELAQSACAHGGAPLAGVWMHNGFLSMGDTKMSKSLGNVVGVEELLAQGWSGEVLRLALLSAHYRQPLAWTEDLLTQSKATLDRWQGFLRRSDVAATEVPERVVTALADDLNTPAVVASIARLSRLDDVGGMRAALQVLGFTGAVQIRPDPMSIAIKIGAAVVTSADTVVAARTAARARKDFAESDRIRDELAAAGIILEDSPSGTTWRRA
jgi:cysteinyl-tRNA synthetase